MSFPRYPKYKDSGVEWLGQVPAHWRVLPIRAVAKLESGHTPSRSHPEYWQNCTTPWFTLADVWQIREGGATRVYETNERVSDLGLANSSARLLPAGTVMLSRTASVGLSAIMGVPMATTQDFANWVCGAQLIPEYLLLALRSMGSEFERLKMGSTHNTIYMPDIQALRIALPPVDDQRQIIRHLEKETAAIDALLAEQRRLIELLKEKRQAVISHAVTKGLHPDAPMKPSGIDWLGDVPAHWRCGVLSRIASRVVVGIAEAATHAYADHGVAILRSTNIRPGQITGDVLFVDPAFAEGRGSKRLAAGDLVTVRTGNAGVTAVVPAELDGCQCFTMLVTTLTSVALSSYYCYWMNSKPAQTYFALEGWGTAQVNISVPILKFLPVPIPPRDEQEAIVAFLDRELAALDALAVQAERAIELLQERRAALISAAVTGQIDVRGLVPAGASA